MRPLFDCLSPLFLSSLTKTLTEAFINNHAFHQGACDAGFFFCKEIRARVAIGRGAGATPGTRGENERGRNSSAMITTLRVETLSLG